jgi:cytochrome b6-f complex iron-sulfur subunit
MSATAIFIIGIAAAGLLAAAAVFVIAFRREPEAGPLVGELDREALKLDRAARRERAERAAALGEAAGGVAVLERTEEDLTGAAPVELADPLTERVEVSEAEFGVTRRMFFNRSLAGIFGIFLLQFAVAGLAFLWPKLKGGFGTPINVGSIADIRRQVLLGDGSIQPLFVAAAQAWVVPFAADDVAGSSFDGLTVPVIASDGPETGLMALWQRCVHLGCRVPECLSSQGFECPCHGSKYNFHGEYRDGPAPRNMDRFAVTATDGGDLVIDTGTVVQTARAKVTTIAYPQGPSCL